MKTKEELSALKEEITALNKKFRELTDEELKQVIGGSVVQQQPGETVGPKKDSGSGKEDLERIQAAILSHSKRKALGDGE